MKTQTVTKTTPEQLVEMLAKGKKRIIENCQQHEHGLRVGRFDVWMWRERSDGVAAEDFGPNGEWAERGQTDATCWRQMGCKGGGW